MVTTASLVEDHLAVVLATAEAALDRNPGGAEGFEPLTPCMPYMDRRPHHGRLRLMNGRFGCPQVTVVDHC